MEEKSQLVDGLIRVKMTAIPLLILNPRLDLLQPFLRAGIYRALVESGQKNLRRSISVRTGVAEYNIQLPTYFVQASLHVALCVIGGLLVREPVVPLLKAIIFIYAVRAAYDEHALAVEVIELTVLGKQKIRVLRFLIDHAAAPRYFLVRANALGAHFVVAVDTENR